jgi:hypothetical protein
MSCVEVYSPAALRERAFAFDGTVTAVRDAVDPQLPPEDNVAQQADLEIGTWYAGGRAPAVTVWMQRDVAVGDRLLVAGEPRWGGEPLDDPIAWECGFTASYSEATADEWAEAFAS